MCVAFNTQRVSDRPRASEAANGLQTIELSAWRQRSRGDGRYRASAARRTLPNRNVSVLLQTVLSRQSEGPHLMTNASMKIKTPALLSAVVVLSAVTLSASAMAQSSGSTATKVRPCTANFGLMKKLDTRASEIRPTAAVLTAVRSLTTLKKLDFDTVGTKVGTGPSQDVPLGDRILTRDMPAGGPARDIQGSCF